MPRRSRLRLRPSGGPRLARIAAPLVAVAMALACHRPSTPTPPRAEFLLATPDSAFWVSSGTTGLHVRGVPMTLAYYGGHFHEVYVADVDRSFEHAEFSGERVYVRDLATGDSTLVYDDTAVVTLAAQHARTHPSDRPLPPDDDDPPDEPAVSAEGETDILGVRGPYVLLEHRFSFSHADAEQDDTVRAAVDLRTGRAATIPDMDALARERDTAAVLTLPQTWERDGATLLARGSESAGDSASPPVSFSLRDGGGRLWPIITVGGPVRLYWLDAAVDRGERGALGRAFNEAAAYGETVKYASRVASHAHRTTSRHPSPRRPGHVA